MCAGVCVCVRERAHRIYFPVTLEISLFKKRIGTEQGKSSVLLMKNHFHYSYIAFTILFVFPQTWTHERLITCHDLKC